jgi:hypothetical protein
VEADNNRKQLVMQLLPRRLRLVRGQRGRTAVGLRARGRPVAEGEGKQSRVEGKTAERRTRKTSMQSQALCLPIIFLMVQSLLCCLLNGSLQDHIDILMGENT